MKTTIAELRQAMIAVRGEVAGPYDVRTIKIEGRATHPLVQGPFTVSSSLWLKGDQAPGKRVDVHAHYQLEAHTTDSDPVSVWELRLEMVGSWNHTGETRFDDDTLNGFAVTEGILVVHPYAREAIQSTVGRFGYPPYTIEAVHSLLERDPDTELDLEELPEDESP